MGIEAGGLLSTPGEVFFFCRTRKLRLSAYHQRWDAKGAWEWMNQPTTKTSRVPQRARIEINDLSKPFRGTL